MPSWTLPTFSSWWRALIGLGLILTLIGCAATHSQRPDDGPTPAPRVVSWGLVAFEDATGQDPTGRLSRGFWQRVRPRLASASAEVVARPGSRLAASWLRAQAAQIGADALVTGTLSGYRVQQRQVWLSLSLKVYQADTGRMLWAKRLVATVPLGPAGPSEAFEKALTIVAREFVDAVAPSLF